jgi:putative chitinase
LRETFLRRAADADAPIIQKLDIGTKLTRIGGGDRDSWTIVSLDDKIGFVETKKLTTFKPDLKPIVLNPKRISEESLRKIAPRGKPEFLKAIVMGSETLFPKYNIISDEQIAQFIAQIAIESAFFTTLEENLFYRAERLREVFPTRFNLAEAIAYAGQPEKIANKAYAHKIGNGDEASGDGWKFRGRGFIQLTGRANYRDIGRYMGMNLENNPDNLLNPMVALEAACCYFEVRGCVKAQNTKAITRLINPALMHLKERVAAYNSLCYSITHDLHA